MVAAADELVAPEVVLEDADAALDPLVIEVEDALRRLARYELVREVVPRRVGHVADVPHPVLLLRARERLAAGGREHLADGRGRRTAVQAEFAVELLVRRREEFPLPPAAVVVALDGPRPPGDDVRVHVGRTRQVGVRGVERAQDLGQDLPRVDVAVRVGSGPAVLPRSEAQHGVVLVVAAPERERGVVAQAFHDLDRLTAHEVLEGEVFLRVLRAGEAEVLPHHDAVFVAPVPERFRLVEAAAPDADHVAVRLADEFERGEDAVPVAAVERVDRRPVRPPDEARLAVHDELHLAGPLRRDVVVRKLQFHLLDAEPKRLLGERLARRVVPPDDRHVVERRFAEAARPPEVRVAEAEPQARRPVEDLRARPRDDLAVPRHRDLDLGMVEAAEAPFEAQVQEVARRPRRRIQLQERAEVVADALGPAHLQPHVAEDAGGDEARQDVPADHVRGLAERLQLGGRARVPDRRDLVELRLDDGRAEEDGDLVRSGADGPRDVERMRDEHVRRLADLPPVHEDVAERVEAVEDEDGLLVRRHRAERERARVEPLVPLPGPHGVLVVRIEEVREKTGGAEVELVAPRHLRGQGPRPGGHLLQRPHAPPVGRRPALQLPGPVQRHEGRRQHRQYAHRTSLLPVFP